MVEKLDWNVAAVFRLTDEVNDGGKVLSGRSRGATVSMVTGVGPSYTLCRRRLKEKKKQVRVELPYQRVQVTHNALRMLLMFLLLISHRQHKSRQQMTEWEAKENVRRRLHYQNLHGESRLFSLEENISK